MTPFSIMVNLIPYSLKVENMIGYSVGEMVVPVYDRTNLEEDGEETRWVPSKLNCYEIVVGWVNPR